MTGEFQYGGIPAVVIDNTPSGAVADALKIGEQFGSVALAPLNATSDWARLMAVASLCATNGYDLYLQNNPSKPFLCNTPGSLVGMSGLRLHGQGSRIISTLTATGNPGGNTSCPFCYSFVAGAGGVQTVNTKPALGSNTVLSNGPLAVGTEVLLLQTQAGGVAYGNAVQSAIVLDCVGGGAPYTLTLSEPILYDLPAYNPVSPTDPHGKIIPVVMIHDVLIEDVIITGTGDRAIELPYCRNSIVRNVRVTADAGAFWWAGSFDVGSRDVLFEDVWSDGGGSVGAIGWALESVNRGVIRRAYASRVGTSNASNCGFYTPSCRFCTVEDAKAFRCRDGFAIESSGYTDTEGCRDCEWTRCESVGGLVGNWRISDGARLTFTDCGSLYPTQHGIRIAKATSSPDELVFTGLRVVSTPNPYAGIYCTGGNFTINGLVSNSNYQVIKTATNSVSFRVIGWESRGGEYQIDINSAVYGRVQEFDWLSTTTQNAITINSGSSGELSVTGGVYVGKTGAGGSTFFTFTGVNVADLNLHISSVKATAYFGVYMTEAGQNLYVGHDCDFSGISAGAGFRYYTALPALANVGTLTLNGVNEVDTAGYFPIDATISLSLATVGGTPGNANPYFSTAQAAGHFYVKSPTVNANDVYNWAAR